ncbi:AraC family transcriptional regulator [Flagellimonas olearia]|uniref:AraC family transcriptional regulator n=1 Tax=Flagellimonas olearia TaxID=552546 RepID=A0A6I1DYL8_9FLAO|nr:helix-turn-helix domain-containing protein [Allomuricauda olearia]KAB7530378.1 AraC family transcriptional regulator [Allomuricauda olearia]
MIYYNEIPPPYGLSGYIKNFWALDVYEDIKKTKTINILADKFPRLVIQCLNGTSGTQNADTLEEVPFASLCGVASEHAKYIMHGRYSHIAIRFYPHAIKEIFGLDAHYAMNTFLDLHNFWPADFILKVVYAKTYHEKIRLLSDFIMAELQKRARKPDKLVSHFLFSGYKNPYKDTLSDYQISERHFVRRFRQTVGITPTMYKRMCRFEVSLQKLRTNNFNELIDISYEFNYADQSHFNREFKLFTGLTPTQFLSLQRKVEESNSFLSE